MPKVKWLNFVGLLLVLAATLQLAACFTAPTDPVTGAAVPGGQVEIEGDGNTINGYSDYLNYID